MFFFFLHCYTFRAADGWRIRRMGCIGRFDLTYDNPQTLLVKPEKISPLIYSTTKHIPKSSAADFFLQGVYRFGSGEEKKKTATRVSASAVVQGAIKQYFLLLLPSQPLYRAEHCCCCPVLLLFFSSQPKKKKKKAIFQQWARILSMVHFRGDVLRMS